MRIILLSPPGAGKGTQAQFIMKQYNIPQISTGNMLRSVIKDSIKLREEEKISMDAGILLNDDLVISLVKERIMKEDCKHGFLLDGFPRTIYQAESMKAEGIKIDLVLELHVPEELLLERLLGRRIHHSSGRVYHIKFNKPQIEGKDDVTGEALTIRQDDREEIVRNRLLEYNIQTAPLIQYYGREANQGNINYIKLDGTQSITVLHTHIKNVLG
ncbi:adenylate kinase [Candidatus Profftia tarda]|nr:adenylate kinase [Candidatus Profftia tarda]